MKLTILFVTALGLYVDTSVVIVCQKHTIGIMKPTFIMEMILSDTYTNNIVLCRRSVQIYTLDKKRKT